MTSRTNGWLDASIAWEVCASLHRQYCKGKDALFTTRQSDFVKHAKDARDAAELIGAQAAPIEVTDEMALAFHHAISDSSIGQDDVDDTKTGLRAALVNSTLAAQAAPVDAAVLRDAERYRVVRRGQHWSVIDGIGAVLRGEDLDIAADAARAAKGGA